MVLQKLNDPKCLDLLQKDPKAQMFGSTIKKLNVKFNEYRELYTHLRNAQKQSDPNQ